ncbi:UNVERIFIED_CONTAM: hypothetical protein GTU68_063315 [Idotea baltica]|nr:hypothetical protein [Idotea baltica]
MQKVVKVSTFGQKLYEITENINSFVNEANLDEGLCTLFIRHTSASLTIQENADPSAKKDLEVWLNDLVPENNPKFTHTFEGPDDMPSHIKSILTSTSLSIPISNGRLVLGTWQGIYLWEHRKASHSREVVVHIK